MNWCPVVKMEIGAHRRNTLLVLVCATQRGRRRGDTAAEVAVVVRRTIVTDIRASRSSLDAGARSPESPVCPSDQHCRHQSHSQHGGGEEAIIWSGVLCQGVIQKG